MKISDIWSRFTTAKEEKLIPVSGDKRNPAQILLGRNPDDDMFEYERPVEAHAQMVAASKLAGLVP